MAEQNDSEKRIIISVDKQAANASLKAIRDIEGASKSLGATAGKLGKSLSDSSVNLKKLGRDNETAASSIVDSAKALDKQSKSAKDATSDLKDYTKALQGAGNVGSIGSSVGDIRGTISTIGGAQAAPALEVAGGVSDAVQAFGTLNPAVIASTIAITALSVVMSNFTKEAEKQASAINATIDAQRGVNEAIAAGLTTEDAQTRIQELEELRAAEQELLDRNQEAYNTALDQISAQASGALGGIAAPLLDTLGLTEGAVQQISAQEEALSGQISASESNIASYNAEINALNRQIESGGTVANDTEIAELQLAETRERESQSAIQAAEQSAARVAALQQQQSDLINNRAIAEANANQVSALESKFAKEDEQSETRAHYANLEAISEAGRKKLEALQSELASIPTEQATELTAIQTKGNAQLSKLQSDYFANQIKATQDFAKEQSRITGDTAKAAKRLAEDIADNLADAARDNDVVAFLKIQRDGQKELKRNAEDAKEEDKRRTEDFLQGQEEQRQAFLQRQAEVLQGIEEEKQRALQSFAERRLALETQIAQERAATAQALELAKQRYAQDEALEAQAANRNAQRLALRQQQEDAAFQRQIASIQSRIAAENSLYSNISGAISRVIAQAQSIGRQSVSSSANASSFYNRFTGKSSSGGFGASNVYSGAPSYARSGSGGFGAQSVVINNNPIVGDIATGSQVTAAMNAMAEQTMGTIIKATQGAQG